MYAIRSYYEYRNTRDLEAHFNNETGEVELYEFVTVVEEVLNSRNNFV